MDKQQTLKSKRSDSRLMTGRRVFSPRLWVLLALIALCLSSAAYGQDECLSKCEHQLADCLRTGQGGGPGPGQHLPGQLRRLYCPVHWLLTGRPGISQPPLPETKI